jgi:hypothetical protein
VREISSILIEKMRRIVILFDEFFRSKAAKDRVLTSTKNLKLKRFGYIFAINLLTMLNFKLKQNVIINIANKFIARAKILMVLSSLLNPLADRQGRHTGGLDCRIQRIK